MSYSKRRMSGIQVMRPFIVLVVIMSVSLCIAGEHPEPAISVPLNGSFEADAWGVGDLNGDAKFDFIVRWPTQQTDPYGRLWHKSTETYKIDAYDSDGTFLWRYDMGWGIEMGVWYAPILVYDIDGDGHDEVYTKWSGGDSRQGRVESTDEWLVKLDGLTGKEVARAPWPPRELSSTLIDTSQQILWQFLSNQNRNMLCVAYLDGKSPSLIITRGTYRGEQVWAYDANLEKQWEWNSKAEKDSRYIGQCSHGVRAADVDGDGRDEIVLGAAVLNEDGTGLWTLGKGHVDICHVADINWDHPGLEIFLGWEKHQIPGAANDVALVDAASGEYIWGSGDEKVYHAHGQGLCADILPQYSGLESYCREHGGSPKPLNRWLYTASGKRLDRSYGLNGNSPKAVYWDGDACKELYNALGFNHSAFIADMMGDWREEIITVKNGRIQVYSSDIATEINKPNLYRDRLYRMDMARGRKLTGYYYQAQLSKRFSAH